MMDLLHRLLLIVCGWLRAEACSLPIAIGSLRVASFLPRSLLVRHRLASGLDHVPSAAVAIQLLTADASRRRAGPRRDDVLQRVPAAIRTGIPYVECARLRAKSSRQFQAGRK